MSRDKNKKLEKFDQEIAGIRVELHKLPVTEEDFLSSKKSIERLEIQAEKQQQLLLKYVEGMMMEISTLQATMKRIKIDRKTITVKEDENSNDRSKIKNVGSDPDSCLFGADRYLQIHKSTDSKKKLLNSKKN
ncbi:transposon Tf2-1 polyprotein isoform X1 [Cucumis melo var. makuwa]|uniref:Transposon Tf2-1 polyprotein isoform X1 n=1 Tax=Cucumis melo var. makuwa TaxID=1194695 RepID=A0A5A7TVL4_CUCMM|nr:transposon Tf2-1 polyprotein isoform X1 [Cucumis melo var. makuwa]